MKIPTITKQAYLDGWKSTPTDKAGLEALVREIADKQPVAVQYALANLESTEEMSTFMTGVTFVIKCLEAMPEEDK